jgi:hypothetical protein
VEGGKERVRKKEEKEGYVGEDVGRKGRRGRTWVAITNRTVQTVYYLPFWFLLFTSLTVSR